MTESDLFKPTKKGLMFALVTFQTNISRQGELAES